MKCSSYPFICVVIHVVTSPHYICLISASCDMPDPIPNTITTLPNQTLDTGSYITWECSDGYMMDGLTNTVVWVCLEDGSWLGHTPICKDVECPSPPIAAYSELDLLLADTYIVHQTISYSCSSSEYTLLGSSLNRCLQDGTWENDPPVCQRTCGTTDTKRYSNLTCYRRRGSEEWDDSFNLCIDQGEILATVKDAQTQEFLVEFLGTFNDEADIWIGASEGPDWKWRKSDKYIERFFWQNPFPDSNRRDCIELSYQSGSAKYSWNPESRRDENALLCQYDQSCQSVGLNQSDMVLEYMDTCFQFLDVSKNCDDGAEECYKRGGFLAEILDESTNALLLDRALYLRDIGVNTAWWIGGYDEDVGRSWYWSDKTRLNYEEWNDNQPNNLDQDQDCVEMRSDFQYRWNDQYCSDQIRTLCQIGIPACGDPGEPLHGNRLPDDRTTYSVNATLYFTCQEGYILSGESVLRCMNNGAWNHERPSCEAVKCEGSPPNVTFASTMKVGSVYQDIAVYTCQDGYIPDNEPISFCQHTGNWSTPNFTCPAVECEGSPPEVALASTMILGSVYQDIALYTCQGGYIPDNEPISFCQYTGNWSIPNFTCSENPKGNSSTNGTAAAGSVVAILFILAVIILTVILFRRRRAATPVQPVDEKVMENYAAVANYYEDSKPADSTPHAPYYPTVEPDSNQNGGFGTSVADQPSPHLGFVDNVLYGTSDEQTVRPSSLNHNSTDRSPGRPKLGHPRSGAPETGEDAYEGEEIMVDNELYGASFPTTPRAHKVGPVVDQGDDAVYEITDGNDPVDGEGDGEMYQNTEFHSVPSDLTANELYKSVDEI